MTTLSTERIIERLREKDLSKRLVVSPLLDPDEQAKAGQAAIDVRLGFEFALVTASSLGVIDEYADNPENRPLHFQSLYRREYVPFGTGIVIHPHQFMLATTLEYIRLPPDLMAYVAGRSTWGRLGLIVATAVGIHPNFAGSLTLELRNLGETPLKIYPGQTIAQLFFHEVNVGKGKIIDPGQYGSGTVDLVPRAISSDETAKKVRALIKRFREASQ